MSPARRTTHERLVHLVARAVELDRLAAPGLGPQPLAAPLGVVRHQVAGGVEDGLRRAVVALELAHHRLREPTLEVEDVVEVGAAPAVDALVLVAHRGEVAGGSDQLAHQPELRVVGVLELVDQEMRDAAPDARGDLGVGGEQPDREHDEIVEVDRRGATQQMLVAAEDAAQPLFEEARGAGRVGLGIEQAALGVRDARQHRARRIGALGQPFVLERALDQRHLVAVVEHHEPRLDAGALGVAPQQAEPEAMEGADEAPAAPSAAPITRRLDVIRHAGEQRLDALAHLGGRLVGEGDRDDARRIDPPLLDQPADAVGDHPRLAGAGAGEHELGPVAVGDGGDLLRVEGLLEIHVARRLRAGDSPLAQA